ncbi:hypothetical protein IF2G_04365 [Cordyceps javanica]|nr:hypothetical protein IF2G_04365 [Cordyceps javanica]
MKQGTRIKKTPTLCKISHRTQRIKEILRGKKKRSGRMTLCHTFPTPFLLRPTTGPWCPQPGAATSRRGRWPLSSVDAVAGTGPVARAATHEIRAAQRDPLLDRGDGSALDKDLGALAGPSQYGALKLGVAGGLVVFLLQQIVCPFRLAVGVAKLRELLHALPREPLDKLVDAARVLDAEPLLLGDGALGAERADVLQREADVGQGEVVGLRRGRVVAGRVVRRVLAQQQHVPRGQVRERVEHRGPRGVVARRAQDLQDRGPQQRVEKGWRCCHGARRRRRKLRVWEQRFGGIVEVFEPDEGVVRSLVAVAQQ